MPLDGKQRKNRQTSPLDFTNSLAICQWSCPVLQHLVPVPGVVVVVELVGVVVQPALAEPAEYVVVERVVAEPVVVVQ